jgi:hypothetical protein
MLRTRESRLKPPFMKFRSRFMFWFSVLFCFESGFGAVLEPGKQMCQERGSTRHQVDLFRSCSTSKSNKFQGGPG